MNKDKAIEAAKSRAASMGEAYCIVQARNGQWTCERLAFVQEDPVGRMLYRDKSAEVVHPPAAGLPDRIRLLQLLGGNIYAKEILAIYDRR